MYELSAKLARESLELVKSAGKKDVKSRKGNDAQKLHRKKKRDRIVTRRKPKTDVECSGGMQLSVEELRMRLRVHEYRTEGNVRFLQRLGARSCWIAKATNKIFERSVKCRTYKQSSELKEESTVFTEEDFNKI